MSLVKITSEGITDGSIVNADLHSAANIASSKLADSGVTAGSYGSATAIPAVTVNAKGIVTSVSTNSVNTTTNLGVSTATDSVTVTSSTGNNAQISEASSSAAGVMSVAHHDKLDGIESGATGDQSNSEIKTAYEANSNTNAFTDALLSKLNGIAASATNVTNNNQLTNGAGYLTSVGTSNITNNAVDFSKLQDIAQNRIIGRVASGSGDATTLTAANVRSMINVEDGATADQSASEILTLLKTVDGNGSGLDADTLDGLNSSNFVRTDTSSTINGVLGIGGTSVSGNEGGEMHITYCPNTSLNGSFVVFDQVVNSIRFFEHSGNNRGFYLDLSTAGNSVSSKIWHSTNDGASSGLDADLLDGQHGSYYLNYNNLSNRPSIPSAGLPLSGGELSGDLITHNVRPDGNGNRNLGTSSYRWANIYTSDLNLSNEGGKNDVDGTWGNFTIQEGAESLFLINKRNGKKYMFNLTEVS